MEGARDFHLHRSELKLARIPTLRLFVALLFELQPEIPEQRDIISFHILIFIRLL